VPPSRLGVAPRGEPALLALPLRDAAIASLRRVPGPRARAVGSSRRDRPRVDRLGGDGGWLAAGLAPARRVASGSGVRAGGLPDPRGAGARHRVPGSGRGTNPLPAVVVG